MALLEDLDSQLRERGSRLLVFRGGSVVRFRYAPMTDLTVHPRRSETLKVKKPMPHIIRHIESRANESYGNVLSGNTIGS